MESHLSRRPYGKQTMRAYFPYLLLTLFLSTSLLAQDPDYVFPRPYYDDFVSTDFEPENKSAVALGSCGLFLRSSDFGVRWRTVPTDHFTGETGIVISCVPGTFCETVIAVTGSGVARSTDFGLTWSANTPFFAAQILHLPDGSIVGLTNRETEAITSSDGGQTWSALTLPSGPQVDAVVDADGDIFYFDTDKTLNRSTDGGATFTSLFTSENFPRRLAVDGNNLLMSDNRNNFFRSTDKGITWTEVTTGLPVSGTIREIWRGADNNLHIMNFLGARATSTDDGATWAVNSVAGFSISAVVIKEGKVLAAGRRLGLWTSEDDWRNYNYTLGEEQYYIAGISFGSRNFGYAIAQDGHVLKTTDGGGNWNVVNKAGRSTAKFIHAYDHEKAFVQTSAGGLQYTIDGGTTFSDLGQVLDLGISSLTALNLLPNGDIAIMNGSEFHVVSQEWELRSTTTIATPVTMPSNSKLTMVSSDVGILTGGGGSLWRTADGGASWTKILDGSITNQPFRETYFINDQLGFSGDQNISIRTIDGGLTWEVYRDLPGGRNFVKAPTGTLLKMASGNRIFESSDNGNSWREAGSVPCGSAVFLAIRPGEGESFISLGPTIARIDVDFTNAVRSPVVNDPEFRVYPNPTQGLLNLEIPALAGQVADVQITDLAGRTVLRGELRRQALAQLDFGGLKAGIYVVSIYAADGVRTRRVMVR